MEGSAWPCEVIGKRDLNPPSGTNKLAPCCKISDFLTRFPGVALLVVHWIGTKPAGSPMPCTVS